MRTILSGMLLILSLLLVACGLPDDIEQFVREQYPNASISNTTSLSVSARKEVSGGISEAWCIELDGDPSSIIVYRDDEGLQVFEAHRYSESCDEWRTFSYALGPSQFAIEADPLSDANYRKGYSRMTISVAADLQK